MIIFSMTPSIIFLSSIHAAAAAALQKRDETTPDKQGTLQRAIYIPVIVVTCSLLIAFSVVLYKRAAKRRSRPTPNGQAVVEVTANQLTGRGGASTTNNGGAPARTRRGRRNRRRASQMSVTSLPLYMEEAGETELVLVRGEREMHDTVPEHNEGDEDSETEEDTANGPEDSTHQRGESASRRSFDSAHSTEEDNELVTSPLMEDHRRSLAHGNNSQSQDSGNSSIPQEDAPPYTEHSETAPSEFREVNLNDASSEAQGHSVESASQAQGNSEPAERPASGNTTTRRLPLRAMPNLRSLFTRTPSGGNNNGNGDRTLASSSSRAHLLSHQRSNSSFSNASSMMHLTPTASRLSSRHIDRSMNASQISLASISAPLQHTLTKTEFGYPKAGPTQEQMKFLGSRESLALFGVPFGSAAVAYSRVEPPPFIPTTPGSQEASNTGGSSSQHVQEATDDTVVNSTAVLSRSSEEPIPEEAANQQEPEIQNETTTQQLASPTSPVKEGDGSYALGPSRADIVTGEEERGLSPAAKTNMPVTIEREPSPAPPTPPPTPPRQLLNVANENVKQPDVTIAAPASA